MPSRARKDLPDADRTPIWSVASPGAPSRAATRIALAQLRLTAAPPK